jgi:cellulose synthase/poly-beta-1,6-N-acetylglucosamine synthase-like glycosyltransferase
MLLNSLLCLIAVLISIPLMVTSLEFWIVLFYVNVEKLTDNSSQLPENVFKILIPAHNEALIIHKTLTHLFDQMIPADSIIVIADNCNDRTAEISRNCGVTVLERQNSIQRGKAFALEYGIDYLKNQFPPAVVVIMDADCETTRLSLIALIHKVLNTAKPAQMVYLMRVVNNPSIKQQIAGFAWLVKNKIRPLALQQMNLPITLTGTGMAFPWQVFEVVHFDHHNLVEDMQLSIDCSCQGFVPLLCEHAVIYSDFPTQIAAEKTQRVRWEHGHLLTIAQQVPRLLKQALVYRNRQLLGLALDIAVPPLSLLIIISFISLVIFTLLLVFRVNSAAFLILLSNLAIFAALLMGIWYRYGQNYLTFSQLIGIPGYIISKLSIYVTFIFNRQTEWIRTDRHE